MRGSVGSPNRREKKQPTTKNQYIFKNARDHTNLGRTHMSNIVWDLFRENMFCFSDMFRIIFRKVSEAYLELSKQYVLHASKHVPDNFNKVKQNAMLCSRSIIFVQVPMFFVKLIRTKKMRDVRVIKLSAV